MRKSQDRLVAVRAEPQGFYELARAHVEGHGGTWFTIDKRADPQAWRAWIAYFAWLDGQTFPKGAKAGFFARLERFTAPAAWPLEFDASAPPSPLPEPPSPPVSAERRKQLAGMLRAVVADHELRQARAPTWRNMSRGQAEDRLDALTADYAGAPPVVATPAMAAYLERLKAEAAEVEF